MPSYTCGWGSYFIPHCDREVKEVEEDMGAPRSISELLKEAVFDSTHVPSFLLPRVRPLAGVGTHAHARSADTHL